MKKFLFIPALTSGFFFAACIVMLFWGALAMALTSLIGRLFGVMA